VARRLNCAWLARDLVKLAQANAVAPMDSVQALSPVPSPDVIGQVSALHVN